jgi:hypothetical protein
MALDTHQTTALADMREIGDATSRIITHARSPHRALTLPDDVLGKLVEAQQTIFAAQRLMEGLLG